MKTIHVRVLRRAYNHHKWVALEAQGSEIQEVPVQDGETPTTADCTEFVRDTLEGYRLHPGDAVMIEHVTGAECDEYIPPMKLSDTLEWRNGRQIITAIDPIGRVYIGTRGSGAHRNRYLMVRTTVERINAFKTGEEHLTTVLTETAESDRYAVLGQPIDDNEFLTVTRFEDNIDTPGILPPRGGTVPRA